MAMAERHVEHHGAALAALRINDKELRAIIGQAMADGFRVESTPGNRIALYPPDPRHDPIYASSRISNGHHRGNLVAQIKRALAQPAPAVAVVPDAPPATVPALSDEARRLCGQVATAMRVLNMADAELADLMGRDESWVRGVKAGEIAPDDAEAAALCGVFGQTKHGDLQTRWFQGATRKSEPPPLARAPWADPAKPPPPSPVDRAVAQALVGIHAAAPEAIVLASPPPRAHPEPVEAEDRAEDMEAESRAILAAAEHAPESKARPVPFTEDLRRILDAPQEIGHPLTARVRDGELLIEGQAGQAVVTDPTPEQVSAVTSWTPPRPPTDPVEDVRAALGAIQDLLSAQRGAIQDLLSAQSEQQQEALDRLAGVALKLGQEAADEEAAKHRLNEANLRLEAENADLRERLKAQDEVDAAFALVAEIAERRRAK